MQHVLDTSSASHFGPDAFQVLGIHTWLHLPHQTQGSSGHRAVPGTGQSQTQGSLKTPFSDCESSDVVEFAFASSVHKKQAKNEVVEMGVRRH